jgi:hypothetical protein
LLTYACFGFNPFYILVVPQFAVILRQALFLPLVMDEKSPLPSEKPRLPCLTANWGTTEIISN